MPTATIPVVSSTDPESSVSGLGYGSDVTNVVFDRYPDGRTYATQRPGFFITSSASASTESGKAIYYWEKVNSFYTADNSGVSAGSVSVLTFGSTEHYRDRSYFAETANHLVYMDPRLNKAYYMTLNDPYTAIEITSSGFPTFVDSSRALAPGVVALDGFFFVMDVLGTIWQSGYDDPTAWSALDFIDSERESDKGIFLCKHHDHIVAIGTRTIEFFYNAGNATGSTLARRQDISYRTGCIDGHSVYSSGDKVYFLGVETKGTMGLYEIDNFQLTKKSSMSIDRALANLGISSDYTFIVTFSLISDHYLVFITAATKSEETSGDTYEVWSPAVTLVYDATTNYWSKFQFNGNAVTGFPVIDIADKAQSNSRTSTLMFTSRDVVEPSLSLEPLDGAYSGDYFADADYMVDNDDMVLPGTAATSAPVEMEIILGDFDGGTSTYKYGHALWLKSVIVNATSTPDPISISWADDGIDTFSTARTLDIEPMRKLSRLGNFRRRAHKIEYSGNDTVRIEAIEIDVRASRYA